MRYADGARLRTDETPKVVASSARSTSPSSVSRISTAPERTTYAVSLLAPRAMTSVPRRTYTVDIVATSEDSAEGSRPSYGAWDARKSRTALSSASMS